MIDLHVHSTASDGTKAPGELPALAASLGITAFALTDHDTVSGVKEAVRAGLAVGVEVIPGIEISASRNGRDIHILGYYLRCDADGFSEDFGRLQDARDDRNRRMAEKLTEAGMPVDLDELSALYPGVHLARPHFARYLMDKGYVKSTAEAFDRCIGDGCPCFVPRKAVTPAEAVHLILEYGGIPVLAHPLQYRYGSAGLRDLVRELTEAGLEGMECIYSGYSPSETGELTALAAEFGLLVTGGSDYHGDNRPAVSLGRGIGGKLYVPETILAGIKRRHFRTAADPYLFFTDLDGTLLNAQKEITPRTMDFLRKFTGSGNILVLCSGRSLYDVMEVYENLKLTDLPNTYLCGYNGAALYDCRGQSLIFREGIPYAAADRVMEIAGEYGIYCQTYSRTGIITHRKTDVTDYYTRWHKMEVEEAWPVSSAMTETPCKCIAIELTDHARLAELKTALEKELGDQLSLFYSNPNYLEIVEKSVSKGNALRRMAVMMGIPLGNTIAAGDSENDKSMLIEASCGIVMCNGIKDMPSLGDCADIITEEDNDHDGLVPVLEKLLSGRK